MEAKEFVRTVDLIIYPNLVQLYRSIPESYALDAIFSLFVRALMRVGEFAAQGALRWDHGTEFFQVFHMHKF